MNQPDKKGERLQTPTPLRESRAPRTRCHTLPNTRLSCGCVFLPAFARFSDNRTIRICPLLYAAGGGSSLMIYCYPLSTRGRRPNLISKDKTGRKCLPRITCSLYSDVVGVDQYREADDLCRAVMPINVSTIK